MAGNARNCFLNRKISFLCEIKVVEVNSGQRVQRQRIPKRRKWFTRKLFTGMQFTTFHKLCPCHLYTTPIIATVRNFMKEEE